MKNFEKKLLSTICAISMVMSPVGSLNVMAEGNETNEVVNTQSSVDRVEELKTLIASLPEITFDNCTENAVSINSAWDLYDNLTDEEKEQLNVVIDEEDNTSDTYKQKLENAKGIVDAAPVMEYIRDKFPTIGGEYPNIKMNNYINYYAEIEEAGIMYDSLSRAAQNRLGDTPYRYKYQKVLDDFLRFWKNDVGTAIENLNEVEVNADNINVENYADKVRDLSNAESSFNSLHADQKIDVQNGIGDIEGLGKDGQEVIEAGYAALDAFKANSIEEVSVLIGYDTVNFENYEEVRTNVNEASESYNALIAAAPESANSDISAKIEGLKAVVAFYEKADAINVETKDDLTPSNYYPEKKALIDDADNYRNGLTSDQIAYAEEGVEYVYNALTVYNEYKEELIQNAENAIDAIPEFDHSTWGTDTWTEVINTLAAADTAVNNVHNDHKNEIAADKLSNYNTKKALYGTIIDDYGKADEFVNLVKALGMIDNVATDSITLESSDRINAAFAKYGELTPEQQGLAPVVTYKAKLDTAKANYDALVNQKAIIDAKIAAFDAAVDALAAELYYDSATADDIIDGLMADVTNTYNDAYAAANDASFGSKLSSYVNGEQSSAKERVLTFAEAFKRFRTNSTALVDKSIELYNLLMNLMDHNNLPVDAEDGDLELANINIDQQTSRDDIHAILEAVMKYYTVDTLEAVNAAITANGEAATNYTTAKTALATYLEDTNGYCAEFDAYVAKYEQINEIMIELDPMESVGDVDAWADAVNDLFNVIERECIENLSNVKTQYEGFCATRDEFKENTVVWQYLVRYNAVALSNLEYINDRISQYERAERYIANIADIKAQIDEIDEYRTQNNDSNYRNKLDSLLNSLKDSLKMYSELETAIIEIVRVQEAYAAYKAMSAEIKGRIEAYEKFDKLVSDLLTDYVMPQSNFSTEQIKFTEIWNNYVDLASLDVEVVISSDGTNEITEDVTIDAQQYVSKIRISELATKEKELAEEAINNLDTKTVEGGLIDAIAEADDCAIKFDANKDIYAGALESYDDNFNAEEWVLVNKAKLKEYVDTAEIYKSALTIGTEINETNWNGYISDIDTVDAALGEWVKEIQNNIKIWKTEIPNVEILLKSADALIGKAKAKVVTYMLMELPDPADIEAMTELAEIEAVKAELDAIAAKYAELNIVNKLQVQEYARYELGVEAYNIAKAAYNQRKADEIELIIDAIGVHYDENGKIIMSVDDFHSYENSILAAEQAADPEVVSNDILRLVENLTLLSDAREEYDAWIAAEAVAQDVVAAINALPDVDDINNENYSNVRDEWNTANEALSELSGRAEQFITDDMYSKMNDIDRKLSFIGAYMEVVIAINDELLGEEEVYDKIVYGGAIDVRYALVIAELEEAYKSLERNQKLEVYNYAVLVEARNAYDANVENAINTIRGNIDGMDIDTLVRSEENFVLISATRELIDSLSDENKLLIGKDSEEVDRLEKFAAIEARYAELKTPEEVIALIDAIGNVDELTEENFEEKKAAAEAAREGFETLSNADKSSVTNYSKLTVWEDMLANFNVDHSGDIDMNGEVNINDINMMVKMALKKYVPTEEEFERANIVKEDNGEEEVIDIFDVLAAIEKIIF